MVKEQVAKSVDFIWDGWLNNLKSFQQLQDDVEKKSLQAFTYQKELLDTTVNAINSLEEESKKATKEWQEKVQNSITELNSNGQFEHVTKWFEDVQEITDKAQLLAWKPSNAMVDLMTYSQSQFETTIKSVVEQQKQERVDTLNKIEELTEQLKETHKKLLTVGE